MDTTIYIPSTIYSDLIACISCAGCEPQDSMLQLSNRRLCFCYQSVIPPDTRFCGPCTLTCCRICLQLQFHSTILAHILHVPWCTSCCISIRCNRSEATSSSLGCCCPPTQCCMLSCRQRGNDISIIVLPAAFQGVSQPWKVSHSFCRSTHFPNASASSLFREQH